MPSNPVTKAAILMVVIVVAVIAGWELYLRSKGIKVAYDDGGPLWSDKRAMVYEPSDKAVVFIGSSRIKFDLDIDTWERLTGTHAIMLAMEGSSPVPVLENLAQDPKFKGRLVIDVTEPIFFSEAPPSLRTPNANIKYYKDRTPAQRASFVLDHALESKLVFLDQNFFSLNSMLNSTHVKSRSQVYIFPDFPFGFKQTEFSRQNKMTDEFLADTNQQNQVKGVWDFVRKSSKEPPASGEVLQRMLTKFKTAIDQIRGRGGEVLFVRTPSSGPMAKGEQMGFPREKYWNKLLETTGVPGIHYQDYPAIDHFVCPEMSHLTPMDAIVFTKAFVNLVSEKTGWQFPTLASR